MCYGFVHVPRSRRHVVFVEKICTAALLRVVLRASPSRTRRLVRSRAPADDRLLGAAVYY